MISDTQDLQMKDATDNGGAIGVTEFGSPKPSNDSLGVLGAASESKTSSIQEGGLGLV